MERDVGDGSEGVEEMMERNEFRCPFAKCKYKSHSLLLIEAHMVVKHKVKWEKIELENHKE